MKFKVGKVGLFIASSMLAATLLLTGCPTLDDEPSCTGGPSCIGSNGDCMLCQSPDTCNSGTNCSSMVNGVVCCTSGGVSGGGGGGGCTPTGCPTNAPWLCGAHCYADPSQAGVNHNCIACP